MKQPFAPKPTDHAAQAIEGGKQQHIHLLIPLLTTQGLHVLTCVVMNHLKGDVGHFSKVMTKIIDVLSSCGAITVGSCPASHSAGSARWQYSRHQCAYHPVIVSPRAFHSGVLAQVVQECEATADADVHCQPQGPVVKGDETAREVPLTQDILAVVL